MAAETWLLRVRQTIDDGSWASLLAHADDPEPTPPPTLRAYAEEWLDGRDLKPRTRQHYRQILDSRILPEFGGRVLTEVTPAEVRAWHAALDPTKPTIRAHSYALLRTIYSTAVADELVEANPCRVKAAGSVTRAKTIRPATLAELEVIVREMPERLRPMVLLAAWCALRFGELAELRRADVDLRHGVLHVRRGVVRLGAEVVVGTPKSAAGVRNVAVPPHLLPVLKEHLGARVERGADALLFPATDGRQLSPNSLYWWFFRARHAAGRDDLRFHDLRHTGAVLAASTGATLAELMARLGHSTPAAAMRYQHAAQDRDRVIAEALSALVRADSASSG
ncbi:tyrosine-type recombinase/integrase [Cellulomonas soli]|uniref:tyrosine-type recombinase/integrase n=1 Tax=Cellulomonas soli TaxID=931535 RepID=UPI0017FF53B2|nr:site-specific integrase [Cellulomonas soli]NYI60273.1 integrase [Cellulomonas soli]